MVAPTPNNAPPAIAGQPKAHVSADVVTVDPSHDRDSAIANTQIVIFMKLDSIYARRVLSISATALTLQKLARCAANPRNAAAVSEMVMTTIEGDKMLTWASVFGSTISSSYI